MPIKIRKISKKPKCGEDLCFRVNNQNIVLKGKRIKNGCRYSNFAVFNKSIVVERFGQVRVYEKLSWGYGELSYHDNFDLFLADLPWGWSECSSESFSSGSSGSIDPPCPDICLKVNGFDYTFSGFRDSLFGESYCEYYTDIGSIRVYADRVALSFDNPSLGTNGLYADLDTALNPLSTPLGHPYGPCGDPSSSSSTSSGSAPSSASSGSSSSGSDSDSGSWSDSSGSDSGSGSDSDSGSDSGSEPDPSSGSEPDPSSGSEPDPSSGSDGSSAGPDTSSAWWNL